MPNLAGGTRPSGSDALPDAAHTEGAARRSLPDEALLLVVHQGVPALARMWGMSERTLRRRCALLGVCVGEQSASLKRDLTERLLAGDLPIASVAARLGFASSQTLARFVRREFGVTPTSLRRRLRWSAFSTARVGTPEGTGHG